MAINRNSFLQLLVCIGASILVAESIADNDIDKQNTKPLSVNLADSDYFSAKRSGRFFIASLKTPHRVLSTSDINGGQSTSLSYLINHQSMEASKHVERFEKIIAMGNKAYHNSVAQTLTLKPSSFALMGTAANVNHLAHVNKRFRELSVDAFVTAGVSGNALRAGDPAHWYEGDNGNEFIPSNGTINIMLLINTPLTEGAQSRAVIGITEAKSAALVELAVASKLSSHLATGTGTDQYIVASPLMDDRNQRELESASPHLKLGELIGSAVFEATKEALRWQNGLEFSSTRDITRALGRFGLNQETLFTRMKSLLSEQHYQLLLENPKAMLMEPRVAAAAFAYAAVLDRIQYGTISAMVARDSLKDQAANVAVAMSLQPELWPSYWQQITANGDDNLEPFIQALALGWKTKWPS